MDPAARTRSTRDRPAKAPLSEEAIVSAALAVTREDGIAAVTMRRVAAELDTGAASLYVYVRNRDELLTAMLDRVVGELPVVEPDPERWRLQLHDQLDSLRVALESYPGLSTVIPVGPALTEGAMVSAENMLGILLAGGIALQDAAWACDILALIVTATASETDLRKAVGQQFDEAYVEEIRATLVALPPERFPNLVAHAAELTSGDSAQRFHFAIDAFLDGLVARSSR